MLWIFSILLFLSSAGIAYQDFKSRLISLWLIIFFGVINVTHFLFLKTAQELLENIVFCLSYFLFSYLILHLFYFIKTKRFQKVVNEKIGWGDIWLVLLIGACIEPASMIPFFTISFIAAIVMQVVFFRENKSIALAAVLVICNGFFILYSEFL